MSFECLFDQLVTYLSRNEINNIIYSLLRYGCRFDGTHHPEPLNGDIAEIMAGMVERSTPDMIIDAVIGFVRRKYGPGVTGTNTKQLEDHMRYVIRQFLAMDRSLREDLGKDSDAPEFASKR